jgi:hypothetical protein
MCWIKKGFGGSVDILGPSNKLINWPGHQQLEESKDSEILIQDHSKSSTV